MESHTADFQHFSCPVQCGRFLADDYGKQLRERRDRRLRWRKSGHDFRFEDSTDRNRNRLSFSGWLGRRGSDQSRSRIKPLEQSQRAGRRNHHDPRGASRPLPGANDVRSHAGSRNPGSNSRIAEFLERSIRVARNAVPRSGSDGIRVGECARTLFRCESHRAGSASATCRVRVKPDLRDRRRQDHRSDRLHELFAASGCRCLHELPADHGRCHAFSGDGPLARHGKQRQTQRRGGRPRE